MKRDPPTRWGGVRVKDVLFDPARERVFQVEDMLYENGYYMRVSVTVRNVLTDKRTEWVVPEDKMLEEESHLLWIGEG